MTTTEKKPTSLLTEQFIVNKIYFIRGQKVMLDRDLAELYGVETKVLNQSVKRNFDRFPGDFMFRLTEKEWESLRSQFVTLETGRGRYPKYFPFAFTEQGVAMLSSVLNSSIAIHVNIQIIRVFTKMREIMLTNKDVLLKLEQLEKEVTKNKQDITLIFQALRQLLSKPAEKRRMIGFKSMDE
ncbi:MAG TPA: ORF6N domain-containing protein [Parafilimonas sp.]|nr:ORF6N domain-containing protein [Parafilimonas sp.]